MKELIGERYDAAAKKRWPKKDTMYMYLGTCMY
jgi:hypothetical protein